MNPNNQQGLTLIELLLAVVLGSLIMAGAFQLFTTTRQIYQLQQDNSLMQDSVMYSQHFLAGSQGALPMAGWYGATSGFSDQEAAFGASGDFAAGQIITGLDGANGGADTLTYRYRGSDDGSVTDCLGRTVCANEWAVNQFSLGVSANDSGAEGQSLRCRAQILVAEANQSPLCRGGDAPSGSWTEPLMQGFDNLQFLYAVNANNSSIPSANSQLTATEVADNGLWNRVVGVRVAVLIQSSGRTPTDGSSQTLIYPSWTNNTVTISDAERRLRRSATLIVALPNQLE